jgi:predicted permease
MLDRILQRLRAIVLRGRIDREMHDEMHAHLERAAERLMARGMPAGEARATARREFGNVAYLQDQARDARGARWIDALRADIRFGLRHLRRTPLSTTTMILVLALGLGLNTALYTVDYSLSTMPPAGVTLDDALIRIRGLERPPNGGRVRGRGISYPEFREYAAQRDVFRAVGAWARSDALLEWGQNRVEVRSIAYVTDGYFRALGVRAGLGAGLPAAPDSGSPALAAVISNDLWERHFARSPAVLGQTVKVNGVVVTIVGVAPLSFTGAGGGSIRVWFPMSARGPLERSNTAALQSHDSTVLGVIARLQPNVTRERAMVAVQTIAARAAQQMTRTDSTGTASAEVVPLLANNSNPPASDGNAVARLLIRALALLILLIPCTNVSALSVGLAAARRREIAVRLSLGASRRRIVRQLMTESVMLAMAAGALGVFIVWALLAVVSSRLEDVQLAVRWPVVAFTVGIALAAGIGFGISPALHATRFSIAAVLKDSGAAVVTRSRLQAGLVIAQVACTQPLLFTLGAIILAFFAELDRRPAPTFNDRILAVSFNASVGSTLSEQQREALLLRLRDQFAAVPGVVAVVPQAVTDDITHVAVHADDRVPGVEYREFRVQTRSAPTGYFAMMGFPIVRGRDFVPTDTSERTATIIRGDLARQLWGSADPIGRRFVSSTATRQDSTVYVVVGVVDERAAGLSGDADKHTFVPRVQTTGSMLIRTRDLALPMIPLVRSVAKREAPQLPVRDITTLALVEAEARADVRRLTAGVLGAGAVALFLCAIGLYAVVSFAVGQRTREIGIRTALGADHRRIVGFFFLRGLRLSVIGIGIGLVPSLVLLQVIATIERTDPSNGRWLLASIIAVIVVGVASLATWIPARRAAGVDPLQALRSE